MNLQAIQTFVQDHPMFFLAIIVWTLIWKGVALWKAGQRREKIWFTVLLVVNTFGILEIIYYYFVGRDEQVY
jgi:Family of unknown function (DUF5652)